MSHAFISAMRASPGLSYIQACNIVCVKCDRTDFICVQVLQNTRLSLANKYKQIPQLSVGGLYDLNQPVAVSATPFRLGKSNALL